jgi:hypothetical protein
MLAASAARRLLSLDEVVDNSSADRTTPSIVA